jgi:hypothetical protein
VSSWLRTILSRLTVLKWIALAGLIAGLVLLFIVLFSYPPDWYQDKIRRLAGWLKGNAYVFPLISPALLVLTFTIDRIIAGRIRQRDARRTWYIKAFIDPNLKEIRQFFAGINADYRSAIKTLKHSRKYNSLDDQEYILLKARQTEVISASIRKLDIELVSVILVTNPAVALRIQTILQEVSTYCTDGIDILDEDYDGVYQKLGHWQGQIMGVLAEPLAM